MKEHDLLPWHQTCTFIMQKLAINGWDEELEILAAGNKHVSDDDVHYFRKHCAGVIAAAESAIKAQMNASDSMEVVMLMPDQVGAFIGAGGTGINEVMQRYGVRIIVEHHRKCFVLGPADSVAAAADHIRELKLQLESQAPDFS